VFTIDDYPYLVGVLTTDDFNRVLGYIYTYALLRLLEPETTVDLPTWTD